MGRSYKRDSRGRFAGGGGGGGSSGGSASSGKGKKLGASQVKALSQGIKLAQAARSASKSPKLSAGTAAEIRKDAAHREKINAKSAQQIFHGKTTRSADRSASRITAIDQRLRRDKGTPSFDPRVVDSRNALVVASKNTRGFNQVTHSLHKIPSKPSAPTGRKLKK